ncbi:SDR family oxidoreductase [Consotaella salsifontis]|uniref:Short-chain dehydrogenase n=1 Tax=Consotaella salsifontis TaxID=1365950 RepID=A0A1T4Q2F0_9HYPH|nr:SDR family oxidoreductase [Consotaella salsifontis]SJZ97995.1 Short-chain dehydrogenase [Consotaella salsifontis]
MPRAVVTGGTAGVGRALSRELARRGFDVAVIARDEGRLAKTAEEIQDFGRRAMTFSVDVVDASAVEAAADAVAADWGGIDLWINDAMTTVYAPFDQMTPEEFSRVTDVVYMGQVHGARAALRHMRKARSGKIVFIGSSLAYRPIPLQSAYCAAKHAVRGFVSALRTELYHEGVPVKLAMMQLPTVNTPQFSWCRSKLDREPDAPPPVYSPETVARAILDAAMGSAEEVFIGRSTAELVMAETVAPNFLDRPVADRAWKAQLSKIPAPGTREGNLFQPVPGDPGAEGRFSAEQVTRVLSLPSGLVRGGALALAGGAAALLGYAAARMRER